MQCNAIVITTDGGGGERSDSASGGRRSGKRPEVQHYKPGAFSGSRKPEDCEGNPGNSNNSTATEKTSSTGGKGGQASEDKPQQPHQNSNKSRRSKKSGSQPKGQQQPESQLELVGRVEKISLENNDDMASVASGKNTNRCGKLNTLFFSFNFLSNN